MGRRLTGPQSGPRRPETSTDVARSLPAPPERPVADTPVLITEEQDVFVRCEAAIETLKFAFWAAGKALQVIRDGRLYRATPYKTFDDYCWGRWGMRRGQANKLIRMWPIAQALFEEQSNDLARARAKLSQAAIWELVPVSEQYAPDAAAHVYRAAEEVAEETVTAAIAKRAVEALPQGTEFDPDAAAEAVRAALRLAPEKEASSSRPSSRTAPVTAPAAGLEEELEEEPKGLDLERLLPWDSPASLDTLLRQHMSAEDRRTLGKLLLED